MGKRRKPLKINADIIQQYKDHFQETFSNDSEFNKIIAALRAQKALDLRAITKETFINDYWVPELKESLETKFNTKIRKTWEQDKKIKKSLQNQKCKNLKEYFLKWYFENMKKGCYYCGQDNLLYVLQKGRFPEKAKNKPRRFLELDRRNNDDVNYGKNNCVLACYPCNNAKSNVFNEKEFLVIGKLIELIINNQLENILSKRAEEIKKLNLSEIVKNLGL
jgi:hypothetical protein